MPDDSTDNYDGPVTVIGLFSVAAAEQDELVKVIGETAQIMRAQRGFLGSEVFASLDGTRVFNCSRWTSVAELHAAREDPLGKEYASRMFAIATPDPTVCVLRSEYQPSL